MQGNPLQQGDSSMNVKTISRRKKLTGFAATFIGCFLFFLIMRQFQK